jgi:hypothetical protein
MGISVVTLGSVMLGKQSDVLMFLEWCSAVPSKNLKIDGLIEIWHTFHTAGDPALTGLSRFVTHSKLGRNDGSNGLMMRKRLKLSPQL